MRVARSAFVTTLVVAVAAVVPAVPASAAVPSVVGDRVIGERVTDLNDPMVTRQGASSDPSMSTVPGTDGIGCWWEPKDDGSTESTCGELMLHTVTA